VRRCLPLLVVLASFTVAVPVAAAATEAGDAGDLPGTAQDLRFDPALDAIDGGFGSGSDSDLYRVCLSGNGTFSATTTVNGDNQLFLFDGEGRGVYGNDDPPIPSRLAQLPAGDALTPSAPGEYLLAIVPWNREPLSPGGAIFPDQDSGVIAPTGPGAAAPLSGWTGRGAGSGAYRVELTGVVSCTPPDTTPPSIDLRAPADGALVERGSELLADFDCSDDGSGVESCRGTVADGEPVDTSDLGEKTFTVSARDVAGNSFEVTHTYTVVDRTPPSIVITAPADGAVYALGEEVVASYECLDERGGSGVARCEGDVPSGEPVDTSEPGSYTFTVEAEDAAGNVTTESVTYTVAFGFDGFLWPLRNPPGINKVNAGSIVPVRFEVQGADDREAVADGYPRSARVACGADADPAAGEPIRAFWSKWGHWRHWKHRRRHHRSHSLLWKTDRRWDDTCRQLVLKLTDGTVHRAHFRFH
jgi:hypothetical protein